MSLKLGIVGTNFVSDWLAEAVALLDGIDAFAVYSRKQETGDVFAKKHSIKRVLTDWNDFLSCGIDAVYIASPTFLHKVHIEGALDKGLHVLCEKPFVMHGEDCAALFEKATNKGVILMEAMRPAHDPVFSIVKESLERLGAIRRVSFEYCQYSSRYDRFKNGEVLNAFTKEISGGALFDIGIYPLFWCVALFGKPKSIQAESYFLDNGFEGGGTLLLGYDGFSASVTYSKICDSVIPSVITGESGSLMIYKMQSPEKLVFSPRKGETEILPYIPEQNNLVFEVKDFLAAIQNGGSRFDSLTKDLYETLALAVKAAGLQ